MIQFHLNDTISLNYIDMETLLWASFNYFKQISFPFAQLR